MLMKQEGLAPMTVGEMIDALNKCLETGDVTREHKIVFYGSSGRTGVNKQVLGSGMYEPEYNGPGTLKMTYAK